MTLDTIFTLFLLNNDVEAKTLLTDFIAETPQSALRIQQYLNEKLTVLDSLASLEALDVLAHFAGLQLIAKENGSPVDDFQLVVAELEDSGTYNRCGRRVVNQVLNHDQLSFYNELARKREVSAINDLATKFEITL